MIDINELTLGQLRELTQFLPPMLNSAVKHPSVGKYCVIRSYAAGVHVGTIAAVNDSESGREVVLENTRRIWSWEGALSCTEISLTGITGGKISKSAERNYINQVIEILPTTKDAERCLTKYE
jgi:hypothetical protein